MLYIETVQAFRIFVVVFQISYTASCPCLSDRHQYPTFFRTMASDIYQAQAIAQLALRFNWTWIGAVVANNDYGHMAVKVLKDFALLHKKLSCS